MPEVMLTTTDNPFNPFIQYDEWEEFDTSKGYYTPQYLARVAVVADSLTDVEYEQAILDAIDEILKINVIGLYKKVTIEDFL